MFLGISCVVFLVVMPSLLTVVSANAKKCPVDIKNKIKDLSDDIALKREFIVGDKIVAALSEQKLFKCVDTFNKNRLWLSLKKKQCIDDVDEMKTSIMNDCKTINEPKSKETVMCINKLVKTLKSKNKSLGTSCNAIIAEKLGNQFILS